MIRLWLKFLIIFRNHSHCLSPFVNSLLDQSLCIPREILCEFCKFGWSLLILELVELLSWSNLIQNITWEVI